MSEIRAKHKIDLTVQFKEARGKKQEFFIINNSMHCYSITAKG